jgi:hypothetical protein
MEISTADTTKFTHYDRDGLLCQEMISLKRAGTIEMTGSDLSTAPL